MSALKIFKSFRERSLIIGGGGRAGKFRGRARVFGLPFGEGHTFLSLR